MTSINQVEMHLGVRSGLFDPITLEEKDVENTDETHFTINVDNSKTLGFFRSSEIEYGDVVREGKCFKNLVHLQGCCDFKVEELFIVFRNEDRHYPFHGTPDNLEDVVYRTGPK